MYSKIQAFLINDFGDAILLNNIENPINSIETISLPTGPALGEYSLQIVSKKKYGGPDEIDSVHLQIIN